MTQSIKTYNITDGSIKSFNFDSDVTASLNAATNANTIATAANNAAQAANTLSASQALTVANAAPVINVISITDSSYNVLDDTAANTTGAYLQITGSNFQSGVIVMVGSNTATSTSLVNSSVIRAQVGSISSGTYPVYVINTNGGTGIKINGLTTSSFPAWSTGATLTGQTSGTAFGINLSATSDSSITYSNTTVLPTGTTLLSNGYFYGTSSPGSTTTYNFDVKATDAENQDATRTFSLTITLPQKLYSWGKNSDGPLGLGNTVNRSSPVQVGTDTNWASMSIGRQHSVAVKQNGTLWTWGLNNNGQLGTSDTISRSSPVQVGSATNWNLVSAAQYHCIATKTDGTLWTWGKNTDGQLGIGTKASQSSPTQVGILTNWSLASAGHYHTISTKTDGTLWAWGRNDYGQLGQNNIVYKSSPTQIGSATDWNKAKANQYGIVVTKTNGTLWLVGRNNYGQLGLNDKVNRSSPTQVGGLTTWSKVFTATNFSDHYFAIKTDGTLWAWGTNSSGQLGTGDTNRRSSPVQIGTDTNWSEIDSGQNFAIGLKSDGTLWLWGDNADGQLGTNNTTYRRTGPGQLGSATTWIKIAAGHTSSMAISS